MLACGRICPEERLHAGLAYLTPQDWLVGRKEQRLEERRDKLQTAKRHRYNENLKRRQEKSRLLSQRAEETMSLDNN